MTITAIGARGTATGLVSTTVISVTPTATVVVGRSLVLTCVTDNVAPGGLATAPSSEHSTVTDTAGNAWTKVGEYTNSPGGAGFDGLTVSVWLGNVTAQLGTSDSITLTLLHPAVDKALSLYEFSTSLGSMTKVGAPDYQTVVAANDFGSSALSGFASGTRLWFRGMGKEANTATALTVSSGFTAITNIRSRNNAAAQAVYGEFKIANSTGETSNPSLAVSGDTASIFAALIEGSPPSSARPQVWFCT